MSESSYVRVEKLPGGQCTVATVTFEKVGSREAPIVQNELFAAAEGGRWRLLVDLSQVTLLASMGLGALVSLHKKCKEEGGGMVVCGLGKDLLALLKLTHLDRVFRIVADRDAGIKHFS
jgi:anti-sigma B factor antagonist